MTEGQPWAAFIADGICMFIGDNISIYDSKLHLYTTLFYSEQLNYQFGSVLPFSRV